MALSSRCIGFFGAGNMAEALMRGLVSSGVAPSRILAGDISEARRDFVKRSLGVGVTGDNREVLAAGDVLIFAVKPQTMPDVLAALGAPPADKLFISICAGVSTAFIETGLGGQPRVVRAMPNTPMLVGAGAAAVARGRYASDEDLETAQAIFQTAAKVIVVDESLMDAVTAVSGSGPAYYFYLTEALVETGVKLGLDREAALILARQTAFGAGKLLAESGDLPETLRHKVTSPGGTTFAAITKMESAGVKAGIIAGVEAAAERSKELGK